MGNTNIIFWEKLYDEIGETFILEGDDINGTVEITVNEIWMEGGAEHQAFIDTFNTDIYEKKTVSFIDFTVTNTGDGCACS